MKKTLILLTLCLSTVVCIAQDNTLSYTYHLQLYRQACKEQNIDSIIYHGERYILNGGVDNVSDVVYVISMAYAIRYDTNRVNYWYDYLKNYSEENDDLFEEELVRLQHDTEEMLKSKKWEKDIAGTWVCVDGYWESSRYKKMDLNNCPMILTILDASKPDGARMLMKNQTIDKEKEDGKITFDYPLDINFSQGIITDGKNKMMALQFSSEELKDNTWKAGIASIGLDFSQELRSTIDASIAVSDMSKGSQIGASLASGLMLAGVDMILSSMAYSYHEFEYYKYVVTQRNENVLDARISHRYKFVDNEGHTRDRDNYDDKYAKFVRWEENDSIYFITPTRFDIITLNPIDKKDPMLDEYNAIKRNASMWKPKYLIPRLAMYALGGYLFYSGIVKVDIEKENVGAGVAMLLGGFIIPIVGITVEARMSTNEMRKGFEKINDRNIEKLRRKANPEISFSPGYNPNYDAVGASVNLKF